MNYELNDCGHCGRRHGPCQWLAMGKIADKSKKVHEVQCSDDKNEFFIELIENKKGGRKCFI